MIAKWSILRNKITGRRFASNNKTLERVYEDEHPEEFVKIQKLEAANLRRRQINDTYISLGLTRVRGSVSGKTYWE